MPTAEFRVKVTDAEAVSALLYSAAKKDRASVSIILAHGAGANQSSGFMRLFASGLSERGFDVVTFNFLYAEKGRKLPDPGSRLESCYRAVIDAVLEHKKLKGNWLVIGGKSMGGRIASQVAAAQPENIDGLVFLGYPLHPPGRPDKMRSEHLPKIKAPMLFVQGSRDAFGRQEEIQSLIKKLKLLAQLHAIEGGDHSFKVPKSAGVAQQDIYTNAMDVIADWLRNNFPR